MSIEVVITARTRNAVVPNGARGFESHLIRHVGASDVSLAPTFFKSERAHAAAPAFPQKVMPALLLFRHLF